MTTNYVDIKYQNAPITSPHIILYYITNPHIILYYIAFYYITYKSTLVAMDIRYTFFAGSILHKGGLGNVINQIKPNTILVSLLLFGEHP